jgi:DNA relaxase NicK
MTLRTDGGTHTAGARAGGWPGGQVQPPSCSTGAEKTTGIHWYRGTVAGVAAEDVLATVSEWCGGESVVVLPAAHYGYRDAWLVGVVRVYAHPERPDMGVCVELRGEACEAHGGLAVAVLHDRLGARCTRLDVAHDGCPFTPAQVRDAWRAGDVRTRCKVPETAREDRQWRKSHWHEEVDGDMFTMGSRQSMQYARCYDRRGFTRFELELKGETAEVAAVELLAALREAPDLFPRLALGWLRRFVDFVDGTPGLHSSRRALLPWWAEFVSGVDRVRVVLSGAAVRTLAEVRDWLERQVAPTLAVIASAFGMGEVDRLLSAGVDRWRPRHHVLLATV